MAKITDEDEYFQIERQAIEERVSRMMWNDRPDILFIGRETYDMLAAPIAKAAGMPVLMHASGATTIANKQGRLSTNLTEALLAGYHLADQIVTPAQHMAARIRALGLPWVSLIPNAVDEQMFHAGPRDVNLARRIGISDGHRVIAHISNLAVMKRARDLLEAAPAVLAAHPEATFLFVGDGAECQRLRDRTSDLGLEGQVLFTGWVPYPDLLDHMRLADIVVMPAEDETQARVYLETRATGRVPVVSDIPAAREVVTHGETGLIFPCADIEALAACLTTVLADQAKFAQIGRAARDQLGHHRLSFAVASYSDLLENLLQAPPKSTE